MVAHDRARDLVRASGTTVRLSVRAHAVDLDAIGGAFSTGVAWPQLDESSRALWTSLGWDAKSWARDAVAADGGPRVEAARRRRARRRRGSAPRRRERHEEVELRVQGGGRGGEEAKGDQRRAPTAGPVKEGSFLDVLFGGGGVLRRAQPEQAPRDGRHATTGSGQLKDGGVRGNRDAGGTREDAENIEPERRASLMMCPRRANIISLNRRCRIGSPCLGVGGAGWWWERWVERVEGLRSSSSARSACSSAPGRGACTRTA